MTLDSAVGGHGGAQTLRPADYNERMARIGSTNG
jgi:hypothetical protein